MALSETERKRRRAERTKRWKEANKERVRKYQREYFRKYRKKNLERLREYQREYREKNRDSLKEVATKWRDANKERYDQYRKDYQRQYINQNPAKKRSWTAKARAAKRNATPSWVDMDAIEAIYMEAAASGMEVDHIVPLQGRNVCGLHVPWNLQLLTSTENRRKHNSFTD